jgi:Mrp family chromosome partitioning ATPase
VLFPNLAWSSQLRLRDQLLISRFFLLFLVALCAIVYQKDIDAAVTAVEGITSVELTFGVMDEEQRANIKKLLRNGRESFISFAQKDSLTRVIGVASGKGGVGKSSLTANLAVASAQKGLRVGILDADVYGHSIPRLMGLIGQRPTAIDQMFIPLESFGVKTVSMEMFKPERSDAIAYRGPLLHRVLEQLLSDAYWGDLDLLYIDLPPGTGDTCNLSRSIRAFIRNCCCHYTSGSCCRSCRTCRPYCTSDSPTRHWRH